MFTSQKESGKQLKPHHHIRINQDMRYDLKMWLKFLSHPTVYRRPFVDFERYWDAIEIRMFSDASRHWDLGFGGVCDDSWMYGRWDGFVQKFEPRIAYLELFTVTATVINWLARFKNRRIVLFCDNQSVVTMINKTTSSCKNCLQLIRILVFQSLISNTKVFAKYIPSKMNLASDYLSRLKFQKFHALNDRWDPEPTPVPEDIWPIEKIWLH